MILMFIDCPINNDGAALLNMSAELLMLVPAVISITPHELLLVEHTVTDAVPATLVA